MDSNNGNNNDNNEIVTRGGTPVMFGGKTAWSPSERRSIVLIKVNEAEVMVSPQDARKFAEILITLSEGALLDEAWAEVLVYEGKILNASSFPTLIQAVQETRMAKSMDTSGKVVHFDARRRRGDDSGNNDDGNAV